VHNIGLGNQKQATEWKEANYQALSKLDLERYMVR
jgi:hypothetical protein